MVVTATSSSINMKSTTNCTTFCTCGKYVYMLPHTCHSAMSVILFLKFSGHSYLCKPFIDCTCIGLFQGRHASTAELTASAYQAVILDQKYNGEPVQVRVPMGKEPMHLMAIFKGKMVIYEVGISLLGGFNTTVTHFVLAPPLMWLRGYLNKQLHLIHSFYILFVWSHVCF